MDNAVSGSSLLRPVEDGYTRCLFAESRIDRGLKIDGPMRIMPEAVCH